MKLHEMKNEKKIHGFSYTLNIANFEAFSWSISLSANILFLKSVIVQNCSWQKCGHKGKDAHEGFLKIREETLGCLNNDLNVFPPSTEGYIPKALS